LASAIGQQPMSKKTTAPKFRFGTEVRKGQVTSKNPGAGTYNSNVSSVGRQASSYNKSAPSFGFGTSSRALSSSAKAPIIVH
jgi:hypothetical protein